MTEITCDHPRVRAIIRFHEKHPAHWQEFQRYSHLAQQVGRRKIGAKLVIERMRWDSVLHWDPRFKFKVTNGLDTLYARMFNRLMQRAGRQPLFTEKASPFNLLSKEDLDVLIEWDADRLLEDDLFFTSPPSKVDDLTLDAFPAIRDLLR